MELPERFKVAEEDEEDGAKVDEDNPETYAHQSMYGIIAAAHSKGNFRSTLQPLSGSESDSEGEGGKTLDASRMTSNESSQSSSLENRRTSPAEPSRHRKNKSENKLLRSFLKPVRERSGSHDQDPMSQSQFLPPRESVAQKIGQSANAIRTDAPILDRKLQAKAQAEVESPSASGMMKSKEASASKSRAPLALPEALAEIFHFDQPEEVISEYACWYLQSVLLQGYMYITQKHVCFYAYLQKKGNIIKSGHLAKQGKRNPRYRRYWFTLKGDILSYYSSAADPYFPNGTIDLRAAISAELAPEKGADKSSATFFTVTMDQRTYSFQADTNASAKEWVRQLQKVIFRSHNDGDSVKISLPLENIVDVESSPMIDFADTVKLRIIDNDETYAVDDYFFTFFDHGKDAVNVLSLMTQDNDAKKAAAEMIEGVAPLHGSRTPSFRRSISVERSPRPSLSSAPVSEPVRSTLSPPISADRSSPRVSSEYSRRSSTEVSRSSLDRGRASFDRGRRSISATSRSSVQRTRFSKSPLSPSARESTESFVTSSEHAAHSRGTSEPADDDMSASTMLTGDGVFRGPTLRTPQPSRTPSGTTAERSRKEPRGSSIKQAHDKSKAQPASTPIPVTAQRPALATTLQHAYTLAGVVRNQGKRMSSYLSSSPKSYYDKFSGAIAGGKRHYPEADGLPSEDHIVDPEDDLDTAEHERRFQQHFSLPQTERLRAVFYCWLHRVLPLYGKVYMSDRRFCFRSLLYGTRTKLVVPYRDVLTANKEKGFRLGFPGMVLVIRGHEELFFDFNSGALRDDCLVTILRGLDVTKSTLESVILTEDEELDAGAAAAEHDLLEGVRKRSSLVLDNPAAHDIDRQLTGSTPMLFNNPNASLLNLRPKTSLRITCLTIGSRGDVQPYIALCKGLIAHGHQVRIATHSQFEGWIRNHGIDFATVDGDPAVLMKLCTELGMFTPQFVYHTTMYARDWLRDLLKSSWKACQNSDLLIESPSAMAGIHIAEALGIPYFRAFTMPWTRTRAYPHAFAVPSGKMGGQYNYATYPIIENTFWQMSAGPINSWRRKTLGLGPTDLGKLQPNKVPFLYNFSPSVVVPPLDFSDWIRVTGYWFLDEADDWTPPEDLLAFIKKARDDGQKIVYIGFGSVPMRDTKQLTQQIVDAVTKADVRCILSKGWSDHFDKDKDQPATVELPPSIFQIRAAPHDWLFKQIDAVVHHGGAGTTGASLRAGVPTIIKPFFGDQYFFGTRVEDLGVGLCIRKITVNNLGKALWLATHDDRMRTKARMLGEQIRQEDGVQTAINAIYRDLEYARSLIKKQEVPIAGGGDEDDTEESWTFVENDSDVEVTGDRRASDISRYSKAAGREPISGSMALKRSIIA